MALIKCSECGKEISDKAKSCIHCGCPIEEEELFTCDNCGADVREEDTVCPKCGCIFEEDEAEKIKFVKEQLSKNNNSTIYTMKDVIDKYSMSIEDAKRLVEEVKDGEKATMLPRSIVKTIIVGRNSRKKMGSALGRAAVGTAILGPIGLIAGATAKTKDTTTFQVIYSDGTQETMTVKNNSAIFKELCSYLDK